MIALSPFHKIELAPALRELVTRPQKKDYVIRTVARKMAGNQPLMLGELVISGHETLEAHPMAREYPVHYRKTYFPGCLHPDPVVEFQNHEKIAAILRIPPPIGATRTTFRSCFLPGLSLDRLSPFGAEPEGANLQIGEKTSPAALLGLWALVEKVYTQLVELHNHSWVHGDVFGLNVIASLSPAGLYLIDFEQSKARLTEDEDAWAAACESDFLYILKLSVYIQAGLGRQEGTLAEHALSALPTLMQEGERFDRAIRSHTFSL